MSEIKDYTVREVYEALAKNGFQHLRGEWFEHLSDGTIAAACVLGQAAANLGVETTGTTHTVLSELNSFLYEGEKWLPPRMSENAYGLGDLTYGLGDLIVYWNDRIKFDESGQPALDEYDNATYELATYKDVTDMAKEILEPYFDKILEIRTFTYKFAVGAV